MNWNTSQKKLSYDTSNLDDIYLSFFLLISILNTDILSVNYLNVIVDYVSFFSEKLINIQGKCF